MVGGILGVMYSVPLRRAMVTGSDLPYPEGVAAAEVLRVGAGRPPGAAQAAAVAENKAGLTAVIWSAVVERALRVFVFVEGARRRRLALRALRRVGATGSNIGLQFALIGVGHLVGLTVGIAMLAGIVLAWGVLVPIMTAHHPAIADSAALATAVWRKRSSLDRRRRDRGRGAVVAGASHRARRRRRDLVAAPRRARAKADGDDAADHRARHPVQHRRDRSARCA